MITDIPKNPICLTILLFHNDEDLVEDQINYYKHLNKQDVIVFNHNSSDNTGKLIEHHNKDILCSYTLSKNISFKDNDVHRVIYQFLVGNNIYPSEVKLNNDKFINFDYSKFYDWISFPESDEFLEGPNRSLTYYEHLCRIHNNKDINKIKFNNIIYWFTEQDDLSIYSPIKRMKYYCYKQNCGIRLYAWRGYKTIDRWFGHIDSTDTIDEMVTWKTRHYEIRSKEHFFKKLIDRSDITINTTNSHYKIMFDKYHTQEKYGIISSSELHFDDGDSEINMTEIFDWTRIY